MRRVKSMRVPAVIVAAGLLGLPIGLEFATRSALNPANDFRYSGGHEAYRIQREKHLERLRNNLHVDPKSRAADAAAIDAELQALDADFPQQEIGNELRAIFPD